MPRKPSPPPRGLPLDDRELYELERSIPLLLGSLLARVVEGAKNEAERKRAREAYGIAYDAVMVLRGTPDDWQKGAIRKMAKARGTPPPISGDVIVEIGAIVESTRAAINPETPTPTTKEPRSSLAEDLASLKFSSPSEVNWEPIHEPVRTMLDRLSAYDWPLLDRLREPEGLGWLVEVLATVRVWDEVDGTKVRSKRGTPRPQGGRRTPRSATNRSLGWAVVTIMVKAGAPSFAHLAGVDPTEDPWKRAIGHVDRKLPERVR